MFPACQFEDKNRENNAKNNTFEDKRSGLKQEIERFYDKKSKKFGFSRPKERYTYQS